MKIFAILSFLLCSAYVNAHGLEIENRERYYEIKIDNLIPVADHFIENSNGSITAINPKVKFSEDSDSTEYQIHYNNGVGFCQLLDKDAVNGYNTIYTEKNVVVFNSEGELSHITNSSKGNRSTALTGIVCAD